MQPTLAALLIAFMCNFTPMDFGVQPDNTDITSIVTTQPDQCPISGKGCKK